MAVNPTFSLDPEEVKVRWEAIYTSDELNARFYGMPRGIYKGLETEVLPGAPKTQLKLKRDITQAVSVASARSKLAARDVMVFLERDITLDFLGTTVYPVYVKLKTGYKIGQTSSATIFTDIIPPNNLDEIGICRVRQPGGPGTDIVVDATDLVVPTFRNTPVASIGQDFGFMPGGSFEDLQAALALTTEITNARTDIDSGFAHPNLTARLLQDFTTVAKRLFRTIDVVRGNVHTIPTGMLPASSFRVSGSFSNERREQLVNLPFRTYDAGGVVGIGLAGTDGLFATPPNNIMALVNPKTKAKFLDLTTNRPVFARLTKQPNTVSTGTSQFTNALTTVSKAAGDYVAEGVVAGMRVIGPDGNAYEVQGPITALTFEIAPSYQSASAGTVALQFESFLASFFISDGVGGETAYSFPAGPDLEFQPYFNAVVSLDSAQRTTILDLVHAYGTIVANLCKTDGTTPFIAAQPGIAAVAAADLVIKSQLDAVAAVIITPANFTGRFSAFVAGPGAFSNGVFATDQLATGISQAPLTGVVIVTAAGRYRVTLSLLNSGAGAVAVDGAIQVPALAADLAPGSVKARTRTTPPGTSSGTSVTVHIDLPASGTFDVRFPTGAGATDPDGIALSVERIG